MNDYHFPCIIHQNVIFKMCEYEKFSRLISGTSDTMHPIKYKRCAAIVPLLSTKKVHFYYVQKIKVFLFPFNCLLSHLLTSNTYSQRKALEIGVKPLVYWYALNQTIETNFFFCISIIQSTCIQ